MLALEQSAENDLLAPGGGGLSDRSDPPPLATGLCLFACLILLLRVANKKVPNYLPWKRHV